VAARSRPWGRTRRRRRSVCPRGAGNDGDDAAARAGKVLRAGAVPGDAVVGGSSGSTRPCSSGTRGSTPSRRRGSTRPRGGAGRPGSRVRAGTVRCAPLVGAVRSTGRPSPRSRTTGARRPAPSPRRRICGWCPSPPPPLPMPCASSWRCARRGSGRARIMAFLEPDRRDREQVREWRGKAPACRRLIRQAREILEPAWSWSRNPDLLPVPRVEWRVEIRKLLVSHPATQVPAEDRPADRNGRRELPGSEKRIDRRRGPMHEKDGRRGRPGAGERRHGLRRQHPVHGPNASPSITCTKGTAAGTISGHGRPAARRRARMRGHRARASKASTPRAASSTSPIARAPASTARRTARKPWSGGGRAPASVETRGRRTRPRFFHTTASCGGETSANTQ